MKISFFSVNNFRGISGGLEQNKIIFDDTNTLFIYGQNNVGKSTFLRAYDFFYRNGNPSLSDFYKSDMSNEISFEIEVELDELDRARIERKAPKQKETYKKYVHNNKIRIKKTWKINKESKKKNDLTNENLTWNYETEEYEAIGYASIGLHTVFQSCMPKPVFIKAMPTEDEAKSILNDILKTMAESTLNETDLHELDEAKAKIKQLQDKMYNPELVSDYEQEVNKYFSKIFGDTELTFSEAKEKISWTENKLGKEFNIDFYKKNLEGERDESIPSSSSHVGHGTIRTAIFTLLLMRDVAEKFERSAGRKDYMVLFEEPELFLYPKIVKELRELIYQVSEDDLPYQVLCASHSPSMIDISKPKSSIIRLIKTPTGTVVHQINDRFLKQAKNVTTNEELRQEMNEILRFNPHICESFYSDEVLLIEGPTEEIVARAFMQENPIDKDIFILNCGTVNNIPFYQKIFAKFDIKYHVVCDTDGKPITAYDAENNPSFATHIQKTISEQFATDKAAGTAGLMRVHDTTFEPAHQAATIPTELRYTEQAVGMGKPLNANLYWKNIISPNRDHKDLRKLPFIDYLHEIVAY
ncbi:AAA family ATPase [Vibrio fluvialis]|nr:AAA family ATPase [Vibrio fluvialis]